MIELRECIGKLSSEDEADRIYAAEDIGYANDVEGVQPLLRRLPAESSRAVREAIFAALNQIEDDTVIEGAVRLLDSDDSFLRNQAVEILRTRPGKALPYLDRAFREGTPDRRKFVVDILAKFDDPGACDILDLALSDPDLNVVITAVETLGALRRTAFRDRVEKLVAADAHPMLLCACIETLAQIGASGSVGIVRERLSGGLHLPGYLHASYLKLLGLKGTQEDVAEIATFIAQEGLEGHVLNALTLMRSRFHDLKLPAPLAVSLQQAASTAPSLLAAYQAIRLLSGLLDRDEVFDFVNGCLSHPEKAVRIAAVQSLRESGLSRAASILGDRVRYETDEEVLQALNR